MMENWKKIVIAGAIAVVVLIILLIIGFTRETPSLAVTIAYPSLVFKPGEFQVDLSIQNTVSSTLVRNSVHINSGDIIKIDAIHSDCERLTDEERICQESLSFKVDNNTAVGNHKIIFSINSENYLNYFLLKNFLRYSFGSSKFEVPINVQTPSVETLYLQSNINYERTSTWLLSIIFVGIAFIIFLIVLAILLWEDAWKLIKSLFI